MAKPTKPSDVDPKDLEGKKAPDLALPAAGRLGGQVRLSDFAGKSHVVLYFYPKDDTPGCTTEACGFRDMDADYAAVDAVVLGVSPDDLTSHQAFISKHKLPFTLLADPDAQAAVRFGVWQEKTRFGKKSLGIARTTFLIDKSGKVARVFKNVAPDGHNEQVIAYIREHLA